MKHTISITDWFRAKSMVANPAKFQLMTLSTKYMCIKKGIYIDIRNICIRVKNLSVQNKMEVKLLGVIIDRKLNFATHVQNICFKAYKRVKALLRIKRFINLEQAKFLATVYWFGCSVMRLAITLLIRFINVHYGPFICFLSMIWEISFHTRYRNSTLKECSNKVRIITQPTQTSLRRLQDVLKGSRRLRTKQDVVTASGKGRRIYDVLKTSDLRHLADVQFATSWKRLIYDVFKTSDLRLLEDVRFTSSWKRPICDVLKTSVKRRRCSNVVATYI